MHRRAIASIIAVTLSTSAGLLAIPAAASASPYWCTVRAELPETLAISSSVMAVPLTVHDDANCLGWVGYSITRADGAWLDGHAFRTAGTYKWLFNESAGPGVYVATSDDGSDEDTDPLIANASDQMDARFDSKFTLYLSRSGSTVRFRTVVTKFTYDTGDYQPWARARVHIQRKQHGVWQDVASSRSGADGQTVIRMNVGAGVWRAQVDDASTIWGGETYSKRL